MKNVAFSLRGCCFIPNFTLKFPLWLWLLLPPLPYPFILLFLCEAGHSLAFPILFLQAEHPC
jgi:hypothetical protein